MALKKNDRIPLAEVVAYIAHKSADKVANCRKALFDALCQGELRVQEDFAEPNAGLPREYWQAISLKKFSDNYLSVDILPDHHVPIDQGFISKVIAGPKHPYIDLSRLDNWLSANTDRSARSMGTQCPPAAYKARIAEFDGMKPPSREDDARWAKERGYTVMSARNLRNELAPAQWKARGRPRAN